MKQAVQIKRRIPSLNMDGREIPGKFQEKVESAELVQKLRRGFWVRLTNGDEIYRKIKDVILVEDANEQSN